MSSSEDTPRLGGRLAARRQALHAEADQQPDGGWNPAAWDQPADQTPAEPGTPPAPVGHAAAHPAAPPAATQTHATQHAPPQPAHIPEHMWGIVDQVLGLVQSEASTKQVIKEMQLTRDYTIDLAQRRALEAEVTPLISRVPALKMMQRNEFTMLMNLVYDELLGISVLGPYWRDDDVTEILVDAWDKVTIEKHGQLIRTNTRFRNEGHVRTVARNLAEKISDRALTPNTPLVTAELPGARPAFALGKVVRSGIAITIRKFRSKLLGMDDLLAFGALNTEMRDFLRDCVVARANAVISGGTGSGKTSMINAMSEFIPDSERVVTLEDAFELTLTNLHLVNMQTKEAASADDKVVVTLADLLVNVLRQRPDRVIIGEIREGRAAVVMMDAANTGHDGTMTTIHANSADRAINFRLPALLRRGDDMPDDVAKFEVASALDVVVQVVRRAGRRFVSEIGVVDVSNLDHGRIEIEPVFVGTLIPDADGTPTPHFTRVGSVRADTDLAMKLADAGLAERWIDRDTQPVETFEGLDITLFDPDIPQPALAPPAAPPEEPGPDSTDPADGQSADTDLETTDPDQGATT